MLNRYKSVSEAEIDEKLAAISREARRGFKRLHVELGKAVERANLAHQTPPAPDDRKGLLNIQILDKQIADIQYLIKEIEGAA